MRRDTRVLGGGWVLFVVALALAGCSSAPHEAGLAWAGCGSTVDLTALDVPPERAAGLDLACATVAVPLDRSGTDEGQVAMRLVKVHRKGAPVRPPLLFLSGGPGFSGVDSAAVLAGWLPSGVLDHFDVIGFDPRGVGRSDPVACVKQDPESRILDLSTDAGYAAAVAVARAWASECSATLGDRARHYSTTATAEDIEAIRVALGVDGLRYVGWSYGAKLGAEYARLHPDRVEAAVLDAPTDPTVDWITTVTRQIDGFEQAFGHFVAWCDGRSECAPLGDVTGAVTALVHRAGKSPLVSLRPSDRTMTTDADVVIGVLAALYDDARWPDLASSLDESAHGDSGGLRALAESNGYARQEPGEPPDVAGQIRFVINCNDSGDAPTEAAIRTAADRLVREDPIFGPWGSFQLLGCTFWDVPRTTLPVPSAATKGAMLVVGTRNDPATPYVGAESMARVLGNAVLLTWEGEGHDAFGRSPCIGEHVVRYLVDLVVPPAGTTCPASS